MGVGIQIRKPEHVQAKPMLQPLQSLTQESLPPLFNLMLILTFPAALVALFFFVQTRLA